MLIMYFSINKYILYKGLVKINAVEKSGPWTNFQFQKERHKQKVGVLLLEIVVIGDR